jgi:hypothetical protein
MEDELILNVQCNSCLDWFPQDHEVANRLGLQAWTTHILEDHPDSKQAQMLDALLLEAILDGRTMNGEQEAVS